MAREESVTASVRRHSEISTGPVSLRDLVHRFQPSPPTSVRSLSIKMGPFVPARDAFRFKNSFPIADAQIEQIRHRYQLATDVVVGAAVGEVRNVLTGLSASVPVVGTVGLPGAVVDAVIGAVTTQLAGAIVDHLVAGLFPGRFGRCGGMAFAGYDFYLIDWTVDERFGTTPPASGLLGDYIFSRLLDSLDLNAGTFLDWVVNLSIMPTVSKTANLALGTAVGSLGGPVGAAFGALLGSQVNVFHLGGAISTLGRTKNEWQRIINKLDGQAAWPVGLVYGDSANPIDQHQILAINYSDKHDGTANLTVWDNNDAAQSRVLTLDFRGSELHVGNSQRPLKGIFLEEYSPHHPPDSLRLP